VCGTLKSKNLKNSAKFFSYLISTFTKKFVSYVGNPKLMNNTVENIEIAFPNDPAEQIRIQVHLSSIDGLILIEITQLNKLKKIKTGLMQDLLTGKIRVQYE